ncbi:MAG: murein L,D-transpeptidase family protein [Polyangiaceae bacterium]
MKWTRALVFAAGITQLSPMSDALGAKNDRAAKAAKRAHEQLDSALEKKKLAFGDEAFIRIFKEEAELEVWLRHDDKDRFSLAKTYPICAYSGSLGPKQKVGDEQAPEGFYAVGKRALNPSSNYHLSFNVGYPNAYDKAKGRTGSLIMVHGDCVSIGCYAMTDAGIDEIYSLVDAALDGGQKFVRVHIFPFRMTAKNVKRHADSEWADFWANLKEGYDLFEKSHVPPDVTVEDGEYAFEDLSGAR